MMICYSADKAIYIYDLIDRKIMAYNFNRMTKDLLFIIRIISFYIINIIDYNLIKEIEIPCYL